MLFDLKFKQYYYILFFENEYVYQDQGETKVNNFIQQFYT